MIRIDYSSRTTLAVCTCGWRYLSTDRIICLREAARHETTCNPHCHNTRNLYYVSATRRRALKL